jgi:2-amino-4-hydroxy-6-hydroxymethyldihydropteridine diphosphokinase
MSTWSASSGYDALLGLGSNVGDKAANIARAVALLTEPGDVRVVRRSRDYRTPPWGKTDQDWFVNACIAVATEVSARELLASCLSVEERMGRVRGERWGPRVIDVDVLLFRDEAWSGPDLALPHPRLTERAFVLVPLADVAPGLCLRGRTIEEWLALTDTSAVSALA